MAFKIFTSLTSYLTILVTLLYVLINENLYVNSGRCTSTYKISSSKFAEDFICSKVTINKNDQGAQTYSYELNACQDKDTYCDFKDNIESQCEYFDSLTKYPGDPCRHDMECSTNLCKGGSCHGRGYNETCTDNSFCKAGYYCGRRTIIDKRNRDDEEEITTAKVCLHQIDNHHTKCGSDYECANNMGCMDGNCVEYYSLKTGQYSSNGKFCQSTFVDDGKCVEITLQVDAQGSSDYTCLENFNSCNYLIKGSNPPKTISQQCQCTMTSSPKSICAYDNSARFEDYIKDLKNTVVTGVHTNRRFDQSKVSPKNALIFGNDENTEKLFNVFVTNRNSSKILAMNLIAFALVVLMVVL